MKILRTIGRERYLPISLDGSTYRAPETVVVTVVDTSPSRVILRSEAEPPPQQPYAKVVRERIAVKRKHFLASLACCAMASLLLLTGCEGKSEDPGYQDEAFLVDLGKGLDRRWDLSDKLDEEGRGDTAEELEELVQCELDSIEKYANEKFEDPKLRELAVSYINVLHEQYDASDAYASTSTDIDSINKWNSVYSKRVIILKDILDNYEVKTNKKHDETRSQIMTNGRTAQEAEDVKSALQTVADGIQFTFEDDGYGNISGTATVTNNTGINFVTAQFDVQLYDAAGVRIETTYASVENWNDGETVNLDIYAGDAGMTASVKIVPSYYEVQN